MSLGAAMITHVVSVLLHWPDMLFQCCFTDHTCCFSVASLITHVIGLMFINQIKCMPFPTSKLSMYVCVNSRKFKKNLANYLCLCRRSCVQNLRWFRGGQRNLNLRNVLQMSFQARVNNPFVIKFFGPTLNEPNVFINTYRINLHIFWNLVGDSSYVWRFSHENDHRTSLWFLVGNMSHKTTLCAGFIFFWFSLN